MFAKLLKYEWKATSKLLGILSLCVLGAGLLGAGAIRAIAYFTGKIINDGMAAVMTAGFSFLIFGLVMAVIAYASGTQIYLVYRFYKSRFTDQGYLTFTLPVSNKGVFLSSYVNTLIWVLISWITVFAAVAIALGLGGVIKAVVQEIPFDAMDYALSQEEITSVTAYLLIHCLGALVSTASTVMVMMASVTAGAVVAKKHKILAAIGLYYAQSVVLGILNSAIQVIVTFTSMASDVPEWSYIVMTGLPYLLYIAWGVGAYILSMHLIDKKLNLP